VFNSYFIGAGERTILMGDVKSALKEKLGRFSRATSFEYHLSESNGIKFIGISHGFDSNLRPHFQDVLINGSIHNDGNYKKLRKSFITMECTFVFVYAVCNGPRKRW
jgi:hypothetical protein